MRTIILALNLIILCFAIPFRIVSFKCDPNPVACMNNFCRVRTLRSKATVIDFMCYHPYPLNSIDIHMGMHKRNSKTILSETREDICNAFKMARVSPLFIRMVEELKQYGLSARGCPISGNITIFGMPVVSTVQFITPLLLGPGVYEIFAIATDEIKRNHIAIPFRIVSFKCDPSPVACMNNFCRVRTLRSKATVIDFMCYHPYPLNSIDVHAIMHKRNSKTIIYEMHEDLCKAFKTAHISPLFIRMFEELKKFGLPATGCPMSGNVSISGMPVVTSVHYITPLLLSNGVYEIFSIVTDEIKHNHIVNVTIAFSVNS